MMDADQAAALRKPFEPQQIGKLPKPYRKDAPKSQCRECGGYHGQPAVHLDYVGHAATTDRLLQVDPAWSWEPMAYDMGGLPMLDANHNLWIKLTVCGVTRLGVGDGNSLKELIGDAIRNAAMRFGVALDLWAKEDLHAMDVERGSEAASPASEPTPVAGTRTMSRKKAASKHPLPSAPVDVPDPPEFAPLIDPHGKQMKALHAGLYAAGMGERVAGLAFMSDVTDRIVESSKDLTVSEAGRVLDELQRMAEGRPFAQEPPEEESA